MPVHAFTYLGRRRFDRLSSIHGSDGVLPSHCQPTQHEMVRVGGVGDLAGRKGQVRGGCVFRQEGASYGRSEQGRGRPTRQELLLRGIRAAHHSGPVLLP